MPKKWLSVDTRQLGRDRDSKFDGFLHLLPRETAKSHFVDMQCWCDPRILWMEEAGTLMVSHRDLKERKKR